MTPTAPVKKASKSKGRLYLLLGILVGAGLVLGGLIAYTISTKPAPFVQPPTPTYVPSPTTPTDVDVPITTTTTDGNLTTGSITWIPAQKITRLNIFLSDSEYGSDYNTDETVEFYKVGTITEGAYTNGEMIIVRYPFGMGSIETNHLIKLDESVILLTSKESNQYLSEVFDMQKIIVDNQTTILDLTPPEIITGPKSRQVLELVPYSQSMFDSKNLKVVFTDPAVGPVYTNILGTNPFPQIFPPSSNGFFIRMADSTSRTYKLKIDFIPETGATLFTWNDGGQNTSIYTSTDIGGCGSRNYASVISPTEINIVADLKKVATNSFGDPIYALKDNNHKLLKTMYDTSYQVYGEGQQKVSYDEFIKAHPLLFWVDPFDRLIKLSNMTFQPMAECGKPVIYLYPPKTTNVSVQVKPEGGLSYSDPAYNNGWLVTAEPNGQLTNMTNGQTYPYLFWEGRGGLYEKPDKGWVVARADVNQFLRDSLQTQGLVGQEIEDFMEFWLPRMQAKPYYFISFYGTRMMDQLAPLTIEPKPDTVIRLLMDFTPLDQPISVKPYAMPKPPARQGFTVIEWGGVIQ